MHVHGERTKKETSEETLGGKTIEVTEEISEAIEAKRTELSRKVDLSASEGEKLGHLYLDLRGLMVDSDMQECAIWKEKGDTPRVVKTAKR